MKRKILWTLINAIFVFSIAATAWALPDWWPKTDLPPKQNSDISSSTASPKVIKQTPYEASKLNYIALKLGGYLPQSDDMKIFDDAFYGELGFGHYFDENFAVEMGVGYTKPGASASAGGASAFLDLTVIPITLGLRGSIPTGTFEPFATAGIGAYYVKADASANNIPGFGSGSGSVNDTVLGYYLGLGANFNLSPSAYLGIEGRYFWAKPSAEGIEANIDGINMTANIGYRF